MPAVDQALAETAFAFGVLVEMHARGVLIKPRREHVIGFLDRHAVHMIDLLARLVILPHMRAAGLRGVEQRVEVACCGG